MRCTTCIKDPVLTSVHYVRHWLSVAINSMLIIPQASGKQYNSRSRENYYKNGGA